MKLLDLFCGAGGAALGYHRAGFTEITGVDILPQKHYPFAFVQGDAFDYLEAHGRDFDAIHASPPCQAFSSLRFLRRIRHGDTPLPELIERTRAGLRACGVPFIIENVIGAPLFPACRLCGSHFGLRVRRHRIFESSIVLLGTTCDHKTQGRPVGVYGHARSKKARGGLAWPRGAVAATVAEARAVMGIDLPFTNREISQAIPPAYTEYLGRQLYAAIARGQETAADAG